MLTPRYSYALAMPNLWPTPRGKILEK